MGAMFFGGVEEERIQFNEESLWSGGRGEWEAYNGGNRPGAYKYLPKVRKLLKARVPINELERLRDRLIADESH